jgi:hypothetical protein
MKSQVKTKIIETIVTIEFEDMKKLAVDSVLWPKNGNHVDDWYDDNTKTFNFKIQAPEGKE